MGRPHTPGSVVSTLAESEVERYLSGMDTTIVEIRAAEGGEDAKLLVLEQFAVYARVCARHGL